MTFMRTLLTNHPLVNILFAVVLVLGLLSYLQMPREQDPEINFNFVNGHHGDHRTFGLWM